MGVASLIGLIGSLLKPILEVFFNAFAEIFTEPDVVKVALEVAPVLDSVDIVSDLDLDVDRFDRLFEGKE